MREEVISSGTVDPLVLGRSSSPSTTPAASSAGASSPAVPTNVGSIDWLGSTQVVSKAGSVSNIGRNPPRTCLSTNAGNSSQGSSQPSCRPWERGDLLRRLATFKPSNWFAKPKGANSLTCAQRGWMNVDIEKIECELCGAHLTFPALASRMSAEGDSTGEAFAKQLDAGHRVTCPWRGNHCADSLVQFPPTSSSALIGGYKDRCDGLLQFTSLPVIASTAIEIMRLSRSTQIDRFLSQLHKLTSGESSREDAICSHSHAQKLISLCGWETRWLPDVQDFEEHSAQSTRNACSFDPTEDGLRLGPNRNKFSASAKETQKNKKPAHESRYYKSSPLLDCSLCGATVRIWDFLTVPRPANIDDPDAGKKLMLTRGTSAASGINGWVATDGMEKEQVESHDEATTNERKSLSNAVVDLNLTMAGGLPSTQSGMAAMSDHFDNGGLGRDLVIGQPSGSEVGGLAASYESRGPTTRKRSLEEGGSTVDRPHDRIQRADSIEATVIDRDGEEVDDGTQDSDGPTKRVRGLDIFDTYNSSGRIDSSGAGPSRNLCFEIDIDVNRVNSFKEGNDLAVGLPFTLDSARASSVIAMDTVCHSADEDSMESVENYPGDADVQFPSSSRHKNFDMNDALDSNYSNQAQQSTCLPPAAASVARETGGSSSNEGEEVMNAETATAYARDRLNMGVSHEAEIHGDFSMPRANSTVGDAEAMTELTENLGQTGESAPGPRIIDVFVREMGREDPHGDSQDMLSRSLARADSGSKGYGSVKANSIESGEKISDTLGHECSAHPSLSCNAMIYSGCEASKDEVTQTGNASITDDCAIMGSDCVPVDGIGPANGENDYETEAGEFDPIKYHNSCCPWVNETVAAAGCDGNSSSSSALALCGWQLTLDALDNFQSLGHIPDQTMQSESAASLYKDDHLNPTQKLRTHHSVSQSPGQI